MAPPTPPSLPVYYSLNGSDPKPVPSSGMFGTMGKQSQATSKQEAIQKTQSSKINVPAGYQLWGATNKGNSYVVEYQNGGKSKKSKRRRNKTKSAKRGNKNKTQRHRRRVSKWLKN